MLGTVSAIGHRGFGYAGFGAYTHPGSATSPTADAIHEALKRLRQDAEQSQALFGEKAAAIEQLRELADECAEPNWDGYGARALDLHALRNAEIFIRALPDGLPLPEFGPEPDGSISLDWIQSRNRLFSISVGSSSRLAYAWLDGTDKGHGVARFDGMVIPIRILEDIRGIMDHGSATFRSC